MRDITDKQWRTNIERQESPQRTLHDEAQPLPLPLLPGTAAARIFKMPASSKRMLVPACDRSATAIVTEPCSAATALLATVCGPATTHSSTGFDFVRLASSYSTASIGSCATHSAHFGISSRRATVRSITLWGSISFSVTSDTVAITGGSVCFTSNTIGVTIANCLRCTSTLLCSTSPGTLSCSNSPGTLLCSTSTSTLLCCTNPSTLLCCTSPGTLLFRTSPCPMLYRTRTIPYILSIGNNNCS